MSKPRELWWGYVKNVIYRYPQYKKEYCLNHQLTKNDQKRMKAVEKTLEEIKKVEYGNLRYEFIEKVYFAKTHCIEDFSMISNIDYPTLLAWNKEFVYQVAIYLGLMD